MKNDYDLQDLYNPHYPEDTDTVPAFLFALVFILIMVAVFA